MPEQPKPVLWLELDESAAGLPCPPKMWWALCSSRIHYEQPMHAGKNPIFPLISIPADQVLVHRDLVIRAIALAEDAMGVDFSEHDAIRDELRALLQP